MMRSKQGQQVADNSTAVQAARDVNIGITPDQMLAIMSEIRGSVQAYGDESRRLVDERFESFEKSVLEKFQNDDNTKQNAFADPDFQYVVREAQRSFARSGDEGLEAVLVDLIAERSKSDVRDRLTLTLNDAVEKAGSLTAYDFDYLARIFAFQNLQSSGVVNLRSLLDHIKAVMLPVFSGPQAKQMDISYLGAHNCLVPGQDGPISRLTAFEILRQRYPGVIFKGTTKKELERVIPKGHAFWYRGGIVPSPFDNKLLISALGTAEAISGTIATTGVVADFGKEYIELAQQHPMTEQEFLKACGEDAKIVRKIFNVYDHAITKNSQLTSLGLAFAHARLSRLEAFNAPLSVWIN